jgi:SulP family sulfate permease
MADDAKTELEGLKGEADGEEAVSPAAPARWRELVFRFVPAIDSLRTYSWRSLAADSIAGITVATVAVPQAMAYALIAGLPPQYGLYTAIVMTTVGALFDSSKQLINGPTNAISIALLSAIGGYAVAGDDSRLIAAAVLMAFLIGCIQTGITLLRLGDLTRYISHSVIIGFTLGASVLLVLDQFKNLLGLHTIGDAHDHFLLRFWLTLSEGGPIHGWTLALGLGSVALALCLRWLNRWLHLRTAFRIPELLVTVILASACVGVLGLEEQGVRVVGDIPAQLPGFALPVFEWSMIRDLSGSALAIALLGLLEAIAMAKGIAAQTGQKLDINQQCLSEGLANLTGSFFHCFPGSGSLTRSSINQQAGAVSQWSGVISAVAVAATILLFAPLARYIPRAALAGILMLSAYRMVDRQALIYHLRATKFDRRIVLLTAASAVFISVEFCILIGIFLSFLFYVPRASRVRFTPLTLTPERVIRERLPADPPCNRMLLYNCEGELFFGSAPSFEEQLAMIEREVTGPTRIVVLRCKYVRNADAVCLTILDAFCRRMERRGVNVLLCGVRREFAKVLHNTGLESRLGSQHIFIEGSGTWSSTLDAVRYAYELLKNDLCDICPRRTALPAEKEAWYYMI